MYIVEALPPRTFASDKIYMASLFKKKTDKPEAMKPQLPDTVAGTDAGGQPSPEKMTAGGTEGKRVSRNLSANKKAARKLEAERKKAGRKEEAARKKAERQEKMAMKKAALAEKKAAKGKQGARGPVGATEPAPGPVPGPKQKGSRKEEAARKKAERQEKMAMKKAALAEKKAAKGKQGARGPKQKAVGKKEKKKGKIGGSRFSAVGLDIGRSSMAAVRLQHQAGGSMLLSAVLDQLPEGIISEGEVQDVEALSRSLRHFWKSHRIRGKKVALGLASQKVVVRTLDFPVMDVKELRMAIEFQAQDYIPIPIEEAVFDFHIMGKFTGDDGIERQKVLVVAAQRTMVMDFIEAVKKARLVIEGIDLQAFALLRSYSPRSFLDETAAARQAVAIVNIASDVTNMIIEANGEPQFTRITVFGGNNFTNAIQDQLGVTFAEAEMLKAQIGLPLPGAEDSSETFNPPDEDQPLIDGGEANNDEPAGGRLTPQGDDSFNDPDIGMPGSGDQSTPGGDESGQGAGESGAGPGEPPFEQLQTPPVSGEAPWPEDPSVEDEEKERIKTIQRALEITADSFADELRRTLEYYSSQEDSLPVGRLLLSGGGSMLPNLATHLSSMFSFEVEICDPLVRITKNKSKLTDDELRALAPRLAIAIGLALEDEG